MAHASHKHFGPGAHGKGDGSGAMTTGDTAAIPDNMVLSNRDKAQHSDIRGLDGRAIQTEQMRDHAANRRLDPAEQQAGQMADEADSPDGRAAS